MTATDDLRERLEAIVQRIAADADLSQSEYDTLREAAARLGEREWRDIDVTAARVESHGRVSVSFVWPFDTSGPNVCWRYALASVGPIPDDELKRLRPSPPESSK